MSWRPRQYIFDGCEEIYDPDEDEEDDDSSSDSSSSCSSLAMDDSRDKDIDEELGLLQNATSSFEGSSSSALVTPIVKEVVETAESDKSH